MLATPTVFHPSWDLSMVWDSFKSWIRVARMRVPKHCVLWCWLESTFRMTASHLEYDLDWELWGVVRKLGFLSLVALWTQPLSSMECGTGCAFSASGYSRSLCFPYGASHQSAIRECWWLSVCRLVLSLSTRHFVSIFWVARFISSKPSLKACFGSVVRWYQLYLLKFHSNEPLLQAFISSHQGVFVWAVQLLPGAILDSSWVLDDPFSLAQVQSVECAWPIGMIQVTMVLKVVIMGLARNQATSFYKLTAFSCLIFLQLSTAASFLVSL